jgi:hypothetical protein
MLGIFWAEWEKGPKVLGPEEAMPGKALRYQGKAFDNTFFSIVWTNLAHYMVVLGPLGLEKNWAPIPLAP